MISLSAKAPCKTPRIARDDFQLRHIKRLRYPAIEAAPALDYEERARGAAPAFIRWCSSICLARRPTPWNRVAA